MENAKLYWLPHCSTCQKASEFLKNKGVEIAEFHNLKESPLELQEIKTLAEKVGGAKNLFSKRAVKYRERKLNERELSEDEMLDLMAEDYTFIKRPVLVSGEKAIAGFSEKNYERFLNNE
jgi:arsenate reductase (glutaredoxin)